jgi:hypothetical protein
MTGAGESIYLINKDDVFSLLIRMFKKRVHKQTEGLLFLRSKKNFILNLYIIFILIFILEQKTVPFNPFILNMLLTAFFAFSIYLEYIGGIFRIYRRYI